MILCTERVVKPPGEIPQLHGGVCSDNHYQQIMDMGCVTTCEPWSILTIWFMVIPSIIRILIMVIINPYEPLDD